MADTTEATETTEENSISGEALKAACEAKGVTIDFGDISADSQAAWWNTQAALYTSADDFIEGKGLSSGGTVTESVTTSGSSIIDDNTKYAGASSLKLTGVDGTEYTLDIVPYINIKSRSVSTSFAYKVSYSSESTQWRVAGIGTYGFDHEVDITSVEVPYTVSIENSNEIHIYAIATGTVNDKGKTFDISIGYGEGYWKLPSNADISTSKIKITYNGSPGPGPSPSKTTLTITATAGYSGRHCDPLNDTSYHYKPVARDEIPFYGSGGYGGHGGGGGAGASTVIIRTFATSKADSVKETTYTKPHGYGGGGGAGGKGGDGCILIFY